MWRYVTRPFLLIYFVVWLLWSSFSAGEAFGHWLSS